MNTNKTFKKSFIKNASLKKYTGIILAAIMVSAVFAMAMPAMVSAVPVGGGSEVGDTTYTGTPTQDTARGGNITEMDFTNVDSQTSRWQGYFGNVTGEIVLSNSGGDKMFQWTWTTSNGGEVFAARKSMAYADWTALVTRTATNINTDFSFSSGSDTATNLFDDTSSAIKVAGHSIASGTAAAKTYNNTAGTEVWETIALATSASPSASDYVFAGVINKGGEAYDGTTKDYQMIVPVEAGETPTYYFYVELT